MSEVKARATCLPGIKVELGVREFNFTFKEASGVHKELGEALRGLGIKKKEDVDRSDQIDKTDAIDIIAGILDGLVRLNCVQGAHSEKILKDVREYIGEA